MRFKTRPTELTTGSPKSISNNLLATFVTAALMGLAAASASAAPVLINGSLTGPVGIGAVPNGWHGVRTPDTVDQNHNIGDTNLPIQSGFAATPSPSPDGGTWAGIAIAQPGYFESISQAVSGFTIGQNYTLKWYHANFGYVHLGTGIVFSPDANAIEVLADGVLIGSGATRAISPDWVEESLTFTAMDTVIDLTFGSVDKTVESYQSIDGIRLTEALPPTNAVPEPAALSLFSGAGLAMLLVGRRRKQKASN